MNSNQTVLQALAKEGVVMTEETLLRAVNDPQSLPSQGPSAPGRPLLDDLVLIASPHLTEGRLDGSLPMRLVPLGETNGTTKPETKTEHPMPSSWGAYEEPAHGIIATWRGICGLAGRGMCRLGIHPAPWVYLHEGGCSQMRDCERCGTTKMRVKHRRQWRYATEQSCAQLRECIRCHTTDKQRERHDAWGESYSIESERSAHRCNRCGKVESWSTADNYYD